MKLTTQCPLNKVYRTSKVTIHIYKYWLCVFSKIFSVITQAIVKRIHDAPYPTNYREHVRAESGFFLGYKKGHPNRQKPRCIVSYGVQYILQCVLF